MKIAKYVSDLLFDFECVVIPGLGGFLTDDKPVSINEVTHSFSPPFRKVHFNVQLRTNDGLLVNHVAQQEQIGYKTAKQRVDQFVFQCHNALTEGKKINFKNIGSLYHDVDKNIVFKQDIKVNYNPNSFGLSSLVSPAITRPTDEEKIKKVVKSAIDKNKPQKKPVDRKGKINEEFIRPDRRKMIGKRRKSTFTNQLIFLLVVIFLMGIGYMYMRRHSMYFYYEKYASHIPFFYSSVNDYLAKNINSTPVATLSRSTASFFPFFLKNEEPPVVIVAPNSINPVLVDAIEPTENTDVISETDDMAFIIPSDEDIEEVIITEDISDIEKAYKSESRVNISNPKAVPESSKISELRDLTQTISSNSFFIIAGSFTQESNATNLVSNLKNQGFDALIADTNKYGMFRVAFSSYNNRATAEEKLLAIRRSNNPKAWLLEK